MQLSELKEELEAAQSPIMRQVFAVLFPFGPAWNSGELSSLDRTFFVPFWGPGVRQGLSDEGRVHNVPIPNAGRELCRFAFSSMRFMPGDEALGDRKTRVECTALLLGVLL